jgi:hypothetical protein
VPAVAAMTAASTKGVATRARARPVTMPHGAQAVKTAIHCATSEAGREVFRKATSSARTCDSMRYDAMRCDAILVGRGCQFLFSREGCGDMCMHACMYVSMYVPQQVGATPRSQP